MRSVGEVTFIEQARRRQILGAAVELLADGGFGAASLSAIAARIGASKGVILYHFADKDELLSHLVASVLSDAAIFMAEQIRTAVDDRARLRTYITANLDYLSTHRREIRALVAVLSGLPPAPDGSSAYTAPGRDAVEALAALVISGQKSGAFRAVDARVAARSIRSSIDAVTQLLREEPDLDVDAYAGDLVNLFEAALLV